MNFVKAYFNSNNKLFLIAPIFLFGLAFYIHYLMVMGYQENLYQFHSAEVRNRILGEGMTIFKFNLIGYSLVYFLQMIGITIALNVGFLFLGYKFKFNTLIGIVLKSSIILIAIYYIIPLIYYLTENVYSFEELYNIESKKYTALRWFNNINFEWAKNAFEMISLTQIAFVLFLSVGIKHFFKLDYKKALFQTSKIYGIALFILICFDLIMELNFNQ